MTATPEAFAAALDAAGGNVAAACRAVGISRGAPYERADLMAIIRARREAPPARLMPAMLRSARTSRGVSNDEMARRLKMAPSNVSRLEAEYAPQIDEGHLTRWAAALGMTLPELLAFSQTDC